jgi:hypothetical protein
MMLNIRYILYNINNHFIISFIRFTLLYLFAKNISNPYLLFFLFFYFFILEHSDLYTNYPQTIYYMEIFICTIEAIFNLVISQV